MNDDHSPLKLTGVETGTIELHILVVDKGEIVVLALRIGNSKVD